MKLSLVVLSAGKLEGKAIEIKVPQFLIGRDPQCHLRPASAMISKKHCALIQKDGKLYLKEFGSTNGSFINDVQVVNHAEVRNGDKLKIGPLLFQVQMEVPAPAKQPAPAPQAAAKAAVGAGAAKGTPPAKPTPTPPEAEPSVDDDIAALLLSSPESETVHDAAAMGGDVPGGTTVFEMPVPTQAGETPPKDADKAKDKNKSNAANTSSAAAAILEKMRKRPRAQP